MKITFAVCFATIYGITLRIVYGFLGELLQVMSMIFLFLSPVIIGFLTVLLWPKKYYLSGIQAFFMPWLTSLVILVITMVINIEGSICWMMIFPFFGVASGIGGIMARRFRKYKPDQDIEFDFEKKDTLKISILLLTPLFAGLIEGDRTSNREDINISRTVVINAPISKVWHELTNINDISAKEKNYSLSTLMGFPTHTKTILDSLYIGGKRKAIYEKGLYFDETITQLEKEKLLVLDIKTDPNKIPPTVMDEHIIIGGKHLDILQDTYTLEKLSENSCRITLSSRFYINTPINWYAGIWAKYMMKDILQSELNLIEKRSAKKYSHLTQLLVLSGG